MYYSSPRSRPGSQVLLSFIAGPSSIHGPLWLLQPLLLQLHSSGWSRKTGRNGHAPSSYGHNTLFPLYTLFLLLGKHYERIQRLEVNTSLLKLRRADPTRYSVTKGRRGEQSSSSSTPADRCQREAEPSCFVSGRRVRVTHASFQDHLGRLWQAEMESSTSDR